MKYPELYKCAQSIEGSLTVADWELLEHLLNIKYIRSGQLLFQAGPPIKTCFIVIEGLFKVFYFKNSTREYIRSFHLPFDIIACFTELMTSCPSKVSSECILSGAVAEIKWDEFEKLIENNKRWSKIAFKILAQSYTIKEERELELLTMNAAERYKILVDKKPEILELVTQHQVSCYLGITPVALTRLKKMGRTSPRKYKINKKSLKKISQSS